MCSYLITKLLLSCFTIKSNTIKLTSIVCLQNGWGTDKAKELVEKPCNPSAFFWTQGKLFGELYPMISIVHDPFECPIWHWLHINKVKLPTTAKTKRDDGLMSCLMSNPDAPPNARWTSCGKHFTCPPWNACPKFCLDCIKKLIPFHVCAASNVHSSIINKACATAWNSNTLIYWRQSTTFIRLYLSTKIDFSPATKLITSNMLI